MPTFFAFLYHSYRDIKGTLLSLSYLFHNQAYSFYLFLSFLAFLPAFIVSVLLLFLFPNSLIPFSLFFSPFDFSIKCVHLAFSHLHTIKFLFPSLHQSQPTECFLAPPTGMAHKADKANKIGPSSFPLSLPHFSLPHFSSSIQFSANFPWPIHLAKCVLCRLQ